MEVRTQQLIYGIAEVIAAHNLLKYVRNNSSEEKIRMAAGAALAGLGYVFGPELEERIKHLRDPQLSEYMQQHLMYAAGGIILGSIAGYTVGPKLRATQQLEQTITQAVQEGAEDPLRPGGLLTIASAGWLGYSLFFDGKTKEEQQRHLWGLGAGVVGYMYGPQMLRKVRGMLVPQGAHDDALELYARGSALIGSIAGGVVGWYKGEQIMKFIGSKGTVH
jgi:membrane protein YqaA with SNARE-associated domain